MFFQTAVDAHPVLSALPLDLALFTYSYLKATLGLPKPAEASGKLRPCELNSALRNHLVEDQQGRHIATFGCLELESEMCLGVQRIRCFPFLYDTFHDHILRPFVAVVPPERYSGIAFQDFNMADAKHRARLWIGRIELLFKCTFRDRNGVAAEYNLAFLSFLYDFKLPAAMGPLQRTAGARMFYVPLKPWTIVLPVTHILGKVPIMRVYLGGSCAPTIPHSFAGQKQRYFKRGCADQAGANGVGSGSMLFEVNVHLWQFGRPQPRTESVAERMERVRAAGADKAAKRLATRAKNRAVKKARGNLEPRPEAT